jgi:hypothetical protein
MAAQSLRKKLARVHRVKFFASAVAFHPPYKQRSLCAAPATSDRLPSVPPTKVAPQNCKGALSTRGKRSSVDASHSTEHQTLPLVRASVGICRRERSGEWGSQDGQPWSALQDRKTRGRPAFTHLSQAPRRPD